MVLRQMGPIDKAIGAIESTIRELQKQRDELASLLPKKPRKAARGWIRHPVTQEKVYLETGEQETRRLKRDEKARKGAGLTRVK